MAFDTLDFVQRLSGQITLSTVRATDNRDVLNYKQILALTVTAGHVTYARTFFATDITDHGFSHIVVRQLGEGSQYQPLVATADRARRLDSAPDILDGVRQE